MAVAQGQFALGGGEPRLSDAGVGQTNYTRPQMRKLHDSSVTFEEYYYYANLTREREEKLYLSDRATERTGILATIFPSKSYKAKAPEVAIDEKHTSSDNEKAPRGSIAEHLPITDEEWVNASRALRTATWSAVFYLITTDILGPFSVPFAIGTLGWGPGIALYTVFGVMAYYSGYLLWVIFLGLDSDQYPLRTYGDLAFRLYGSTFRHGVNFLQSVQLLCNVGIIVISNGQGLSQVSKFRLCYAICCLIWALCGFFIGQVRTLQKYGWLANFAIWLNLLIIFISMGVFAHSPPNYAEAQAQSSGAALSEGGGASLVAPDAKGNYPPVIHFGGLPDPSSLIGGINGLMQGVYAYGGAMLFTEFMSEMRRPRDFIKALSCATAFIYCAYMLYGLFVYNYIGQYAFSVSYQGISSYAWQTVCNMLAVISGIIAAGLYGNIGIKVLYNNILVDFCRAPPLTSKKGKILWAFIVPIYWSIAFIFAAAIPDFFGLTAVVAAICIMQFTYTFPPILAVGYYVRKNALRAGEGFDPASGTVIRHDSGIKRTVRGFFAGQWWLNIFNILYAGGALATAGLGAYSAIEGLRAAFQQPQTNAFSCTSPLAPS